MRAAFTVNALSSTALRPLNYSERRSVKNGLCAVPLGQLASRMGAAYKHIFTNIDAAHDHGIEVLSQSDIYAAEPFGRFIRPDCIPQREDHQIRRWQILLAGAGTLGPTELYGRPVIADARLSGKYVAYHNLDISFEEPGCETNLYVFAVLASSYGVRALRSTSYGTKILSLRLDLVRELPIPIPNDRTVLTKVAVLVRQATEHRERYAKRLADARRIIESLPEMQAAHAMCRSRQARCTMWSGDLRTLCAWNFASTGDALAFLLAQWPGRLGDVMPANGIFRGNRFARIPCEPPHGVNLFSQRDVFLVRPVPQRVVIPNADVRRLSAPAGSLLAGGQGTLGEGEIFGRVAIATRSLEGSAVSEHLLRIQPNERHRALVYAFLSTLVGLRLVRSAAVGTKLLSLRPDLLLKLPIPSLQAESQLAVDQAVVDALDAHETAHIAEREAIRIVEEEVLPQWLA